MKANIHKTDKVLRILIAVLVAALFITGNISGIKAIIIGAIAAILLITVFINFCPVYHFLGISTKKSKQAAEE